MVTPGRTEQSMCTVVARELAAKVVMVLCASKDFFSLPWQQRNQCLRPPVYGERLHFQLLFYFAFVFYVCAQHLRGTYPSFSATLSLCSLTFDNRAENRR